MRHHREICRAERWPERPEQRREEQDRDEPDPDDRRPADELVVPLQVPRARLEVGIGQAQVDRDRVGDVEPDHADAGEGEERRRVTGLLVDREQADDRREHDAEPHRVGWRAGLRVDAVPMLRARQRTVTAECVDHPAVGGHRRHATEELGDDRDEHDQLRRCRADRVREQAIGGVDEEGVCLRRRMRSRCSPRRPSAGRRSSTG